MKTKDPQKTSFLCLDLMKNGHPYRNVTAHKGYNIMVID
jgi:hypothetical protein